MVVLLRIVAALAAGALYYMVWWLVTHGWLWIATWRGYHIPGYHEPGPWWSWALLAVWFLGLFAVVWVAAFRLPWWRTKPNPDAIAGR